MAGLHHRITGNSRVEIEPFTMVVPVAIRNKSKRRQQVRSISVQKHGRLICYHSRRWRHELSSEQRSTLDRHQLQEWEATRNRFIGNCIEQEDGRLKIVKPDVVQVENHGRTILQGWSNDPDEYEMVLPKDVVVVYRDTPFPPVPAPPPKGMVPTEANYMSFIESSSTCLCETCIKK